MDVGILELRDLRVAAHENNGCLLLTMYVQQIILNIPHC